MDTGEIGDQIQDSGKQRWFQSAHAQTATYAVKGWYVSWELIVYIDRKSKEI